MYKTTFILGLGLLLSSVATAKDTSIISLLAKKTNDNSSWTWSQMTKLPYGKWNTGQPRRSSANSNDYLLISEWKGNKNVTVEGNQKTPTTISFFSFLDPEASVLNTKESEKPLLKPSDIANSNELVEIQTQCSEKPAYFFRSTFYKWQRKGYQNLYLHYDRNTGSKVDKQSIIRISPNLSKLCG